MLKQVVDVTVVIPTIGVRRSKMHQALGSIHVQSVVPAMTIVEQDEQHRGAAATRNTALKNVSTEWVAFLDDDDLLYPEHLRLCLAVAEREGADVVYPWYDYVVNGEVDNSLDPLAVPFRGELRSPKGIKFGREQRDYLLDVANFIPVTVLARTQAVRDVGGFAEEDEHEDWSLWKRLLLNDAHFVHLPVRTWRWRQHDYHTNGKGDRW